MLHKRDADLWLLKPLNDWLWDCWLTGDEATVALHVLEQKGFIRTEMRKLHRQMVPAICVEWDKVASTLKADTLDEAAAS